MSPALPDDVEEAITTARAWIANAQRIAVLTGAGISTESGIPDFRGPNGLWTKDPDAEKMATIQHYLADPEVRKRSWQHRADPGNWRAEPNSPLYAVLARSLQLRHWVIADTESESWRHGYRIAPDVLVETVRSALALAAGKGLPAGSTKVELTRDEWL